MIGSTLCFGQGLEALARPLEHARLRQRLDAMARACRLVEVVVVDAAWKSRQTTPKPWLRLAELLKGELAGCSGSPCSWAVPVR